MSHAYGLSSLWLFMWIRNRLFNANTFPQVWHLYSFRVLWVLKCELSWALLTNILPHVAQWWGLSLEWICRCCLICLMLHTFPQNSHTTLSCWRPLYFGTCGCNLLLLGLYLPLWCPSDLSCLSLSGLKAEEFMKKIFLVTLVMIENIMPIFNGMNREGY